MKELLKKKGNLIIYICCTIVIIVGIYLKVENRRLELENNKLQANNNEVRENNNEDKNKDYIKKENNEEIKETNEDNSDITHVNQENSTIEKNNSASDNVVNNSINNDITTNSVSSNNTNSSIDNNSHINNNVNSNSSVDKDSTESNEINEKSKMLEKAYKFFADRGIEINSSGYSEMLGTNLNSGINELEGHRVFAFTIKNYDIVNNNIWFYYSPDTNVGYRYKDGIWTNANEVKYDTDNSANSENIVDEKSKMLEKAYKFFTDRGIEINSSGYSEMLGTNLNSGINELEGHRVFAFTIKNYDVVNNNIWFYYSPDTNVGYRYENETWIQL